MMFTVSEEKRNLGTFRTVAWLKSPPALFCSDKRTMSMLTSSRSEQGNPAQPDLPVHSPLCVFTELVCCAQQFCISQTPHCCKRRGTSNKMEVVAGGFGLSHRAPVFVCSIRRGTKSSCVGSLISSQLLFCASVLTQPEIFL